MRKRCFLLIFVFIQCFTKSQVNQSRVPNEFLIFAGPIYSNITNDNVKNDQYAQSMGSIGFNIGGSFCFYFGRNFGLNVGAAYNRYENNTMYKGGYRSNTSTVDRFNNIYYPTVVSNYTNTIKINTIDIPIALRINAPINESFDWFVDLGIRLNAIITNKFQQQGSLDKKGSYPTNYSNVFFVIENDPYYGYTSTVYGNPPAQVDSKGMGLSFQMSTGFKASITEKTFITVSGHYMSGMSDVGPIKQTDYQNIFGVKSPYAPYKLFQAGIDIGVGFKFY